MTRAARKDRACPDCGSPARGNSCRWYNPASDGPPCEGYVYVCSALARERRNAWRWLWVAIIVIVVLAALIASAFAQVEFRPYDSHARHHAFYQNWVNQADKGCCNNQDCGELADERTSSGKLEVRIEGRWCEIQPHHYLKRGNVPNAASAHVCVRKLTYGESVAACDRLLCYQPRPGI